MSLLQICQDAAAELKLPTLSSVVGNSSPNAKLLLALCNREVKQTSKFYNWPQLTKTLTITLVNAQANYAFADDHDRQLFETHWDRTQDWPLVGPVSPQEWQAFQSGAVVSLPRKRFRIFGYADNQIYIDPTPGSGDAGSILAFEYQSKNCVRPKTWVTNTAFGAGSYCFYNGNIYMTASAGTTGATPPTHTSGTSSDGGISWAYFSDPYDKFLADTDEPLLDAEMCTLGVIWRFLKTNRLDYQEEELEWEIYRKTRFVAIRGARTIRLGGKAVNRFADLDNAPDTGYGS